MTTLNMLARLKAGLKKTQEALAGRIDSLLFPGKLDEACLEELEEILLAADVGVATTQSLLSFLRDAIKKSVIKDPQDLRATLKARLLFLLNQAKPAVETSVNASPYVILVLGVNGTGKTTTVAKLAHRYKAMGKSVLLAAADTYRAAALEQLEVWAERLGVEMVHHQSGGDPSAVAFDALRAASCRKKDVLLIDTAGRFHTNRGLMEELKKMKRTIQRQLEGAPHETLLILDATTGSNALQQAQDFHQAVGITGLVVTKLDGTAKGGMVVAVADRLSIPVRYIGLGESLEDLQEFDPPAFVNALFSSD
jgi:fused signal recognition particle receptor